ncbi:MAG TPA: RDD family protein [Nevskiaceae bacterium]|nr:RDD family protein [Nevskiaceae bacterium]
MTTSPATRTYDRRDVITPNNFRVAPHLYGLPLASPLRRLAAIALDGLLLAVLIGGGSPALVLLLIVFGVGAARRRRREGAAVTTSGMSAATLAVVVTLAAGAALWNFVLSKSEVEVADEDAAGQGFELPPGQAIAFGLAAARLTGCADSACRGEAVDDLTGALDEADADPKRAREAVDEIIDAQAMPDTEKATLKERAAKGLGTKADAAPTPGSTPEPPPAREKAGKLMRDGGFSVLATLRNLVDDLGISAGWAALYFTLFTWLWNGQTPGKRALGLRVIHLHGKPLTWWDGFERFGGYAAGLATGLLGYLQVYWDSNRQAIHDRVSFTAVIRDPDGRTLERALQAATPPPAAAAPVAPTP